MDPERFRSLLTEGPMRSRIIGHGVRVAAYDLTFSAPKSASVVFALGGEETARSVVRAHGAAVDEALRISSVTGWARCGHRAGANAR